ncbi:MAG TPA: hypothetical protein VFV71_00235 [Burkholderiales bacterium]|nr:hypothetical protein [Burkholderiales bacterium]
MVVGDGMMARAFARYAQDAGTLVFASGVSDSLETDPLAFARERSLLEAARAGHPDALLVYFSTCSVEDPDRKDTPYVKHKLAMEDAIAQMPGEWLVFRLPLVIGSGHRGATLAQFLYARISAEEKFQVWANATRYPVDVDDVVRIASVFIGNRRKVNRCINIALRSFPVLEFVRVMQDIVGKPARYELLDKGAHYEISCPELRELPATSVLDYSGAYLERVLRKYFGK